MHHHHRRRLGHAGVIAGVIVGLGGRLVFDDPKNETWAGLYPAVTDMWRRAERARLRWGLHAAYILSHLDAL
jgi:hypothetical protein